MLGTRGEAREAGLHMGGGRGKWGRGGEGEDGGDLEPGCRGCAGG